VYISKSIIALLGVFAILCIFLVVFMTGTVGEAPKIPGVRAEFYLFALTLIGVGIFHHHTLYVALTGLASLLALKFLFVPSFSFPSHVTHEAPILVNLLGLLLGFAVLAKHFEESRVPEILPRILPDDWKGGFLLLVMVFVFSTFLDNIAAAIIGGTVAMTVFKGKVDIGYLAGIVAASNAGGAGSVLGDTTTTMMWIDGVEATWVLPAFAATLPALLVFGVITSFKQQAYQPIQKDPELSVQIDWVKLCVVAMILAGAIATNLLLDFPAAGVWGAIMLGAVITKTPWHEVTASIKGAVFLLSLVLCASMMPVNELPQASWVSALVLGFVSAAFDNIPLTKLALDQGGYDWAVLAYAVGFGGSMIWFGSSAGVAISNQFPQARSVGAWIKHGWSVPVAYLVGFAVMMAVFGWNPHTPHKTADPQSETHPAAHRIELREDPTLYIIAQH